MQYQLSREVRRRDSITTVLYTLFGDESSVILGGSQFRNSDYDAGGLPLSPSDYWHVVKQLLLHLGPGDELDGAAWDMPYANRESLVATVRRRDAVEGDVPCDIAFLCTVH